jgi:hypothetical protein
LEKEQELKEK